MLTNWPQLRRFLTVTLCDLITWPWLHKLLALPFALRLTLCFLSFPICIAAYLYPSPLAQRGLLLMIPMGLSSWLFQKTGACGCYFGYLAIQVIFNSIIFGGFSWPEQSTYSLISNSIILFIAGSVAVSLRRLVDEQESMRLKAEHGEREAAVAYEQQVRLNQLRSQFIVNVNHELRTPLTATYGYLELMQLLMDDQGFLDRTLHGEYLEKALLYCDELKAIVNQVLDTIEIGNDGIPPSLDELAVAAVVRDVLQHFDTSHRRGHPVFLDISEQLTVYANIQCVRHILYHLLSNAFKYSPSNTQVRVSAAPITDAKYICICVQDKGPGIPVGEIPLLFEPFVRLQGHLAGTIRGTGLGLYISKRLTESMGGRIWVESKGEGSCFCFTLPCASQPPVSSPDTTSSLTEAMTRPVEH